MTTTTLPRPTVPGGSEAEDDWDHIYCCDPDRALCGLDLSETEDVGELGDDHLCPCCEVLADLDLPCGVEGCANQGRL